MFEFFLQTPDCHSAQLTWNPGEDINIEFGQQSPFELLLVLFTIFVQIRKVFDSKSFFVYSFILAHSSSLSYMYIMRHKIDEGVWDISLERSFFRDTLSCKKNWLAVLGHQTETSEFFGMLFGFILLCSPHTENFEKKTSHRILEVNV